MNTQHELDSYLLSAVEWARAAGLAHLRHFRKSNLDIRTKLNDADIVTVADPRHSFRGIGFHRL